MKIAIQGEQGSNSHMAAMQMFAKEAAFVDVIACAASAEVIGKVVRREVHGAVLPIENSLHGSVAEHYDLLLAQPVQVTKESSMRVRHNAIVSPGVRFEEIRSVISHPVALSQCRRWLSDHPEIEPTPFYDTAGSVKHIMENGLRDVAAIAPALAAQVYGADVLIGGIEDHAENYTRFHWVVREGTTSEPADGVANKMSVAFSVEHRPGTLVSALESLARLGADLTKIESRPVPGRPWEYVFYIDVRFHAAAVADGVVSALKGECAMVKELGRYVEAHPG